MTREELVQSPNYWKELYENECFRLGIESDKVKFSIIKNINEEELNNLANYYMLNPNTEYAYDIKSQMEAFKAGYRKAKEE